MSLPNYVEFSKTETVVTLAEDRGTLKTNTYGDYFLRKFTDGRFCCAAPELERMLIERAPAWAPRGRNHLRKARSIERLEGARG